MKNFERTGGHNAPHCSAPIKSRTVQTSAGVERWDRLLRIRHLILATSFESFVSSYGWNSWLTKFAFRYARVILFCLSLLHLPTVSFIWWSHSHCLIPAPLCPGDDCIHWKFWFNEVCVHSVQTDMRKKIADLGLKAWPRWYPCFASPQYFCPLLCWGRLLIPVPPIRIDEFPYPPLDV
jgi:hypothetical protein